MSELIETTTIPSEKDLFVKIVISNWELQNKRLNNVLAKLSDEQLLTPVAPNKNRGTYIFGHLIAISDALLPLLGLGEKLYPELEAIYVKNPDNVAIVTPSVTELKDYWEKVNAKLSENFEKMQPNEWFTKHASISAEDFAKEPHRNKLNILMNRTNHESYHLGQLIFLQ